MGFFDLFHGRPRYSEIEVAAKAWAGVNAYKAGDFRHAVKMFTEYFKMKGFGNYPRLDADDFRMTLNLMISQFYCRDYRSCKDTCKKLINMHRDSGDPYAFGALCSYKLGDYAEADRMWEIARQNGSQTALIWEHIADVKINGYND